MRFTRERFLGAWREAGASPPQHDLFDALRAHYGEPHRAYHTAQHIEDCLAQLDRVRNSAAHAAEIELALWFHDAIYDTRAPGNEERSAQWAARELDAAGAAAEVVERVQAMILMTRHDAVPITPDEALAVDIDLSILGAPHERFFEYERQVRVEYQWVPADIFRRERAKILRQFLARPSIYVTTPFQQYESQARRNLEASVAVLEEGNAGV